jgi:hypothetical protein
MIAATPGASTSRVNEAGTDADAALIRLCDELPTAKTQLNELFDFKGNRRWPIGRSLLNVVTTHACSPE